MQRPFPDPTNMLLYSKGEIVPVVPGSFIDGSAPSLRTLQFRGIPFPELPKLLVSATHLVDLLSSRYSPFRIHFTQRDGRCPLRVDLPPFFLA